MKRLLIILSLFLSLSVSAQLVNGIGIGVPFQNIIRESLGYVSNGNPIRVLKTSNALYVRSYFNDTSDIVYVIYAPNINFNLTHDPGIYTRIIDADLPEVVSSYNSGGVILHSTMADGNAPYWGNNIKFAGGNHTCIGSFVISAGHDKTSDDIGSLWDDGTYRWYLARIGASDSLFFVGRWYDDAGTWKINETAIAVATLTHDSGAVNTTNIACASQGLYNTFPSANDVTYTYLVNGTTPLQNDVVTTCNFLDVIDTHTMIDPRTYEYAVPMDYRVGEAWINDSIIYRYGDRGSIIIKNYSDVVASMDLDHVGFHQSFAVSVNSPYTKRWAYIPKTLPVASGLGDWDFEAIQDFTTNATSLILFDENDVTDTDSPPDRMIQYITRDGDSTTGEAAFVHGYSLLNGLGTKRGDNCETSYWDLYPNGGKSYPRCVDNYGRFADTSFYAEYYRSYYCPTIIDDEATSISLVPDYNGYLLYLDYHTNVTDKAITLPTYLSGYSFSLVEKSTDFSYSGSSIGSDGTGLSVTVANNYGYGILKLTFSGAKIAPSIVSQPESDTVDVGDTVSFGLVANNATSYQWQYSDDGTTFSNLVNSDTINGAKSDTLTINGATGGCDGNYYRCYVSGNKLPSVISDTVTLCVEESYLDVLEDGNTAGWYIASDVGNITKDGSNFVSEWADTLGSGHDLLQSGSTEKPVWSSSGITFDGIDDFMQTNTFVLDEPNTCYIVFEQVSWASNSAVFDGGNNLTMLSQFTAPNGLIIYSSGAIPTADQNLTTGVTGIVRVVFNGSSSTLQVFENTALTSTTANDLDGITLGSRASGGNNSNIIVKEFIVRDGVDNSSNQQLVYDYLEARYLD